MKRGVPPTARNARTGELTPPGMTRRARSVDVARVLRRRRLAVAGADVVAAVVLLVALGGQRPEEAVGNDIAHAGTEARVERLVEERECLADGGVQLDSGREQCGERGRERFAGADEGRLEAFELLAGDRTLRRREHVVEE